MIASTRPRTACVAAALALASAALLGACGSSGGSDPAETTEAKAATTTTTADAGESTTTTVTESTTTTEATDGGETTTTLDEEGVDTETSELDTLPDGDHYGYMAGLEKGKVEGQDVQVILWDEVEFLTGQEAVDAAHEDGAIPEDQDYVENDYYIRNRNQTIRHLAVVPEASVTTLDEGSSGSRPSSVDEVWQQEHLFKINVGNVRGITTISSIDAVFLP